MEVQSCSVKTPKSLQTKPMDPSCTSKVRVIVRVRPFLSHEIPAKNGNPTSCISVLDPDPDSRDEVTVHLQDPDTSRKECYQLDAFFGQEDNNLRSIFEREVSPLIPGMFRGRNATVFAYGATGSGKTYTMQGTNLLPGLMPLAMSTILSMCQRTGSRAEISYYEVYIERCYDLLEVGSKEIVIQDDKDGMVHLKGLSRVPVNSISEFQEVFSRGIQRRKTADTGINDVSSRSHGVLVVAVSTPGSGDSGTVVSGKLNLIDLAGNEDNRRTCNEGIRLLESSKINQSLFALSNVIRALNNKEPRVPYRDSKLTRILQDSLGGASHALMVACLNPGEYQESVRTVSLAARSRHISNFVPSTHKQDTPKVKVDMEEKLRTWLESRGKTKSAQRIDAYGSPIPPSSIKKPNYSSAKAKVNTYRNTCNAKERGSSVPFRSLFNDEGLTDSCLASTNCAAEENGEKIGADSTEISLESSIHLPIEPLDKEYKITSTKSNNSVETSPIAEVKCTERGPLRKALSPINANVNQIRHEEEACKCPVQFEPKTPSTATCAKDKFVTISTPLDKFNAMSSSLKSSLMQEYVDILNTASREELLEIKGIGVRLADYIAELRETSPLKSLSDLEKIGLSSKQVYNMFSKAARGIFDKQDGAQLREELM
ncbi:hypothetical protein POTOM_025109 [Populus tomentosa]|uniref:Kinesin-like protein n=1 Tax=Populus tomentosa TaxID=118781 RepID=A0A8X7ZHH8_POPTO|nr:hypothetical protein POTOM_025109 [Populus tomentosa]